MIKFRYYDKACSLGMKYVFGFNVYGDLYGRPTIDLIIGKHVFVIYWMRSK